MSNRWGIPNDVENHVKLRDNNCVYCRTEFLEKNKSRKNKPSWEHIVNDIRINGIDNIAICCVSCNASKGAKTLDEWLQSDYCKRKKINELNISPIAREALLKPPKLE